MFAKFISFFVLITFLTTSVIPPQYSYAQNVLDLPVPGTMIAATPMYAPVEMKGLMIHPENPLSFEFIMDSGDTGLGVSDELKAESEKIIKYFLAALTVPEDQVWVNLSPYEKDRIVAESLGQTEMGRDLLAQDYMLKQLTSSLMYPEDELGKKFWEKVYERLYDNVETQNFASLQSTINTFNKIWIVPNDAQVYEKDGTAYIVNRSLKVMLEEDYVALAKNQHLAQFGLDSIKDEDTKKISQAQSEVIRAVLIPEIEREVNEGQTFAKLRQIYDAMILASWYKIRAKESLLGRIYVDQNRTDGVMQEDAAANEKIWQQYVESFQKGVFDLIQEDYDPKSQSMVPRKYFSGGVATFNPDKGMLSAIVLKSLVVGGAILASVLFTQLSAAANDVSKYFRVNARIETTVDVKNPAVVPEVVTLPETLKVKPDTLPPPDSTVIDSLAQGIKDFMKVKGMLDLKTFQSGAGLFDLWKKSILKDEANNIEFVLYYDYENDRFILKLESIKGQGTTKSNYFSLVIDADGTVLEISSVDPNVVISGLIRMDYKKHPVLQYIFNAAQEAKNRGMHDLTPFLKNFETIPSRTSPGQPEVQDSIRQQVRDVIKDFKIRDPARSKEEIIFKSDRTSIKRKYHPAEGYHEPYFTIEFIGVYEVYDLLVITTDADGEVLNVKSGTSRWEVGKLTRNLRPTDGTTHPLLVSFFEFIRFHKNKKIDIFSKEKRINFEDHLLLLCSKQAQENRNKKEAPGRKAEEDQWEKEAKKAQAQAEVAARIRDDALKVAKTYPSMKQGDRIEIVYKDSPSGKEKKAKAVFDKKNSEVSFIIWVQGADGNYQEIDFHPVGAYGKKQLVSVQKGENYPIAVDVNNVPLQKGQEVEFDVIKASGESFKMAGIVIDVQSNGLIQVRQNWPDFQSSGRDDFYHPYAGIKDSRVYKNMRVVLNPVNTPPDWTLDLQPFEQSLHDWAKQDSTGWKVGDTEVNAIKKVLRDSLGISESFDLKLNTDKGDAIVQGTVRAVITVAPGVIVLLEIGYPNAQFLKIGGLKLQSKKQIAEILDVLADVANNKEGEDKITFAGFVPSLEQYVVLTQGFRLFTGKPGTMSEIMQYSEKPVTYSGGTKVQLRWNDDNGKHLVYFHGWEDASHFDGRKINLFSVSNKAMLTVRQAALRTLLFVLFSLALTGAFAALPDIAVFVETSLKSDAFKQLAVMPGSRMFFEKEKVKQQPQGAGGPQPGLQDLKPLGLDGLENLLKQDTIIPYSDSLFVVELDDLLKNSIRRLGDNLKRDSTYEVLEGAIIPETQSHLLSDLIGWGLLPKDAVGLSGVEESYLTSILYWLASEFPDQVKNLNKGLNDKMFFIKGDASGNWGKQFPGQVPVQGANAMTVVLDNHDGTYTRIIILDPSLFDSYEGVSELMVAVIHEVLGIQPFLSAQKGKKMDRAMRIASEIAAFENTVKTIKSIIADLEKKGTYPLLLQIFRQKLLKEEAALKGWKSAKKDKAMMASIVRAATTSILMMMFVALTQIQLSAQVVQDSVIQSHAVQKAIEVKKDTLPPAVKKIEPKTSPPDLTAILKDSLQAEVSKIIQRYKDVDFTKDPTNGFWGIRIFDQDDVYVTLSKEQYGMGINIFNHKIKDKSRALYIWSGFDGKIRHIEVKDREYVLKVLGDVSGFELIDILRNVMQSEAASKYEPKQSGGRTLEVASIISFQSSFQLTKNLLRRQAEQIYSNQDTTTTTYSVTGFDGQDILVSPRGYVHGNFEQVAELFLWTSEEFSFAFNELTVEVIRGIIDREDIQTHLAHQWTEVQELQELMKQSPFDELGVELGDKGFKNLVDPKMEYERILNLFRMFDAEKPEELARDVMLLLHGPVMYLKATDPNFRNVRLFPMDDDALRDQMGVGIRRMEEKLGDIARALKAFEKELSPLEQELQHIIYQDMYWILVNIKVAAEEILVGESPENEKYIVINGFRNDLKYKGFTESLLKQAEDYWAIAEELHKIALQRDTAMYERMLIRMVDGGHVVPFSGKFHEAGIRALFAARLGQYEKGLAAYAVAEIFSKDNEEALPKVLDKTTPKAREIFSRLIFERTPGSDYVNIFYNNTNVLYSKMYWGYLPSEDQWENAEATSDPKVKIHLRPDTDQNIYLVVEAPDGAIEIAFTSEGIFPDQVISISEVNNAMMTVKQAIITAFMVMLWSLAEAQDVIGVDTIPVKDLTSPVELQGLEGSRVIFEYVDSSGQIVSRTGNFIRFMPFGGSYLYFISIGDLKFGQEIPAYNADPNADENRLISVRIPKKVYSSSGDIPEFVAKGRIVSVEYNDFGFIRMVRGIVEDVDPATGIIGIWVAEIDLGISQKQNFHLIRFSYDRLPGTYRLRNISDGQQLPAPADQTGRPFEVGQRVKFNLRLDGVEGATGTIAGITESGLVTITIDPEVNDRFKGTGVPGLSYQTVQWHPLLWSIYLEGSFKTDIPSQIEIMDKAMMSYSSVNSLIVLSSIFVTLFVLPQAVRSQNVMPGDTVKPVNLYQGIPIDTLKKYKHQFFWIKPGSPDQIEMFINPYYVPPQKTKEKQPSKTPKDNSAAIYAGVDVNLHEEKNVGGINLSSKLLGLQIQRDEKGIPLPFELQDLEKLKDVKGFLPVIIDIKPIFNLPQLLGLNADGQADPNQDVSSYGSEQAIRES